MIIVWNLETTVETDILFNLKAAKTFMWPEAVDLKGPNVVMWVI